MKNKAESVVVFIHGLARKPSEQDLARLWLEGIETDDPRPNVFPPPNKGVLLDAIGAKSSFNYWADVFYGNDYETDFSSYYESGSEKVDEADPSMPQINVIPQTPREIRFIEVFEEKLRAASMIKGALATDSATSTHSDTHEIAGLLPKPIREIVIKKAAMEAFYYLFNKDFVRGDGTTFQVRQELRSRLIKQLQEARAESNRVIIVSHSMGTMIAYDVLRNCEDCPEVEALITLGSPLGISEVQDELRAIDAKQIDFPAKKLKRWVNIYDPLDPICGFDPKFDDFKAVDGKSVEDIRESNWGKWRHTITHYFAGTKFREQFRALLTGV